MSFPKSLSALAALAVLAVLAVLAAPGAALAANVTVRFENQHASQAAAYSITNTVQAVTNANANPEPQNTVPAGGTDIYTVGPVVSSVTTAEVLYKIGSKQCVFHTDFTFSGTPKWNKSATSSGGAICTATITYVNATTYDWNVTFTMK
jgi:hypothetical protein